MNPFLSRLSGPNSWVLPVTVMSLTLGVMIHFAWRTTTQRANYLRDLGPAQLERIRGGPLGVLGEYTKVQEEVASLREKVTQLENSLGSRSGQTAMLNESLQKAKDFAGLTPMQGQGVKIVLTDGAKSDVISQELIIHDVDVLKVVNELWAAGAEAVSVNDHRVVGRSSFRCVGPVIHVDNVPIASPVTIKAIGSAEALFGGLNLPLGVLDEIRQTDPKMVSIEKMQSVRIEGYSGSTKQTYATPVKSPGSEGSREDRSE